MPQTATPRNQKTSVRQATPQAVAEASPAETEDQVYGLVSVLYHALQGVQACDQYIADAEEAEDDELVKFFQECRDEQNQRAHRAKQLLVRRAEDEVDDEEEEDEDDEEEEDEEDES